MLKKIRDLEELLGNVRNEVILTDKSVEYLYENFEINLILKNDKRGLVKQFFSGMFSSINSTPLSSMGSISYSDVRNEIIVNKIKVDNDTNERLFQILKTGILYDLMDQTILFKMQQ